MKTSQSNENVVATLRYTLTGKQNSSTDCPQQSEFYQRKQSGFRSFGDLIRLSSSERKQPGSPSEAVNVAVQIKISSQLS